MNERDLFRLMSEIDETYILEASPVSFKPRRSFSWRPLLAYATVLVVAVFIGIGFLSQMKMGSVPDAVQFNKTESEAATDDKTQEAAEPTPAPEPSTQDSLYSKSCRIFVGEVLESNDKQIRVRILKSYAGDVEKDDLMEFLLSGDSFPEEGSICLFETDENGRIPEHGFHDLEGIDYETIDDLQTLKSLIGQ